MTSSFEDRRKDLGLSRNDAANLAGLGVGEVWSVEKGKQPRGGAAVERKYDEWLSGEEAKKESGWTVPLYTAPPGGTSLPEYRGLKLGDRFTVRTEPGLYTFMGLVRDKNGLEHIAAYGGRPGYGMMRAFALWKVAFPANPLATDEDDFEDRESEDVLTEIV